MSNQNQIPAVSPFAIRFNCIELAVGLFDRPNLEAMSSEKRDEQGDAYIGKVLRAANKFYQFTNGEFDRLGLNSEAKKTPPDLTYPDLTYFSKDFIEKRVFNDWGYKIVHPKEGLIDFIPRPNQISALNHIEATQNSSLSFSRQAGSTTILLYYAWVQAKAGKKVIFVTDRPADSTKMLIDNNPTPQKSITFTNSNSIRGMSADIIIFDNVGITNHEQIILLPSNHYGKVIVSFSYSEFTDDTVKKVFLKSYISQFQVTSPFAYWDDLHN